MEKGKYINRYEWASSDLKKLVKERFVDIDYISTITASYRSKVQIRFKEYADSIKVQKTLFNLVKELKIPCRAKVWINKGYPDYKDILTASLTFPEKDKYGNKYPFVQFMTNVEGQKHTERIPLDIESEIPKEMQKLSDALGFHIEITVQKTQVKYQLSKIQVNQIRKILEVIKETFHTIKDAKIEYKIMSFTVQRKKRKTPKISFKKSKKSIAAGLYQDYKFNIPHIHSMKAEEWIEFLDGIDIENKFYNTYILPLKDKNVEPNFSNGISEQSLFLGNSFLWGKRKKIDKYTFSDQFQIAVSVNPKLSIELLNFIDNMVTLRYLNRLSVISFANWIQDRDQCIDLISKAGNKYRYGIRFRHEEEEANFEETEEEKERKKLNDFWERLNFYLHDIFITNAVPFKPLNPRHRRLGLKIFRAMIKEQDPILRPRLSTLLEPHNYKKIEDVVEMSPQNIFKILIERTFADLPESSSPIVKRLMEKGIQEKNIPPIINKWEDIINSRDNKKPIDKIYHEGEYKGYFLNPEDDRIPVFGSLLGNCLNVDGAGNEPIWNVIREGFIFGVENEKGDLKAGCWVWVKNGRCHFDSWVGYPKDPIVVGKMIFQVMADLSALYSKVIVGNSGQTNIWNHITIRETTKEVKEEVKKYAPFGSSLKRRVYEF